MKKRQREILEIVYQNQKVLFDDVMDLFNISKRTLYYDIQQINEAIKRYGKIEKIKKQLVYIGDSEISTLYKLNNKFLEERENRYIYILDRIFNDEFTSLEKIANELAVSKNTVVYDVEQIKKSLKKNKIDLIYKKRYQLEGNEENIRKFYIKMMFFDNHLLSNMDERIKEINVKSKLYLTDYSISALSKYLNFAEKRIKQNKELNLIKYSEEISKFDYYDCVTEILSMNNEWESLFITAYIASLTTLKNDFIISDIDNFVDTLIMNFQNVTAVEIAKIEMFKSDLCRHLQSSYYRIKYDFPSYNPCLTDIEEEYGYLLNIVNDSIKNIHHPVLSNMRKAEIGFVTMYFGAKLNSFSPVSNRVLIVCPNGLMMSRALETQLYNHLPTIDVVDVVSISELDSIKKPYDYIISTIPIEDYNNVLVVKPILSNQNIAMLTEKLVQFNPLVRGDFIEDLIQIIKKNTELVNEGKLRKELINYIYNTNNKKDVQPMLSDLLTRDRMKKVKSVNTWEEAIKLASQVLVDDGSIEESYIDSMIESVKKYGPYIVLEEGFALPHSNDRESVNRVSMSLLYIEEAVDLLGEAVNVIVILATTDNNTHLRALGSLSEMLETDENMDILRSGDFEEINKLIKKYD